MELGCRAGYHDCDHEGRRARFGGMMAGPDYVQWYGVYELEKDLVELEEMREELLDKASGQGGGN